jgi:hypothetical protein
MAVDKEATGTVGATDASGGMFHVGADVSLSGMADCTVAGTADAPVVVFQAGKVPDSLDVKSTGGGVEVFHVGADGALADVPHEGRVAA